MSTAGGPRLEGIGRSGDSDIVLCMDAHDAGSYPGEPTTNDNPFTLSDSATDGSGQGSVGTRTLITDNHVRIVDVASNTRQTHLIQGLTASTTYTISTLYKKLSGTPTFRYQIQAHSGASYLRTLKFTNTAETGIEDKEGWQLASWTFVLSSDANAVRIWYQDGADYTTYTHSFELKNPQLEAKAYATPFVREPWNYFGGGNARPASINLMIHGDVGTGSTFEDSSPSKHTVTATGSMAHSSTQSKFPGGSIYFPSADYLDVTSSDFAFGTIDWTIDFWLNQSTTLGWATPVDTYGVAGSGFILGFDASTNYLAFYSEPGIGWANAYGSHAGTSFALTNGTWYHVAYVRYGNAFTCYVNGAVYFTATLSASDNYTSTGLYMGRRGNMNGPYEGYLDEIRITNGTALWTSAFTPPTRRNLSAPVVDRSGNHNGANLINGTDTDTSTYRVGEVIRPIDSAVWDFDGTDEFLTTPFGSGRNVYTNPVSVCAWVKADSTTAARMWLDVGSNGTNQRFYCALITASNPSIFGTQGNAWSYSAAADTSKWYHQALVMDNGTARAYYDGIAGGTRGFSSYTLPSYVRIGGRSGYEWDGQIAAVQIYDTILTPQQVKANFNAQRSRFKV